MALTDTEIPDPADELRGDIEAAIEQQQRGDESAEEAPDTAPSSEETSGAPDRDERGRFKPRDGAEGVTEPAEKAVGEKEVAAEPDVAASVQRPPPAFSVASKAAWEDLPQAVRDDIAKREQEIGVGMQRYTGLARFAEEAERNGTTLQNAVSDYVAIESELRRDFLGGLQFLCQKMGRDPRAVFSAIASAYGGNGQAAAPQVTPMGAPPVDPQAIAQYVANIVRTETQQREIDSQIAKFEADPKNKFFPNLRMDMAQLVQAGFAKTLQDAYEKACKLHPEISTLINESGKAAATASRARSAAKAIGGAPASGSNPDGSNKRQNLSLEDEIRAAISAQEGA